MIAAKQDDETLTLDPTCPVCKGTHDVDEVFDGSERQCGNCGHTLVCVTYMDGSAYMQIYPSDRVERTGRQRTRARWNRQGRRG